MFLLLTVPPERMEHYRAAPVTPPRQPLAFSFVLERDCWLWQAMHAWEDFAGADNDDWDDWDDWEDAAPED